MKRIKNSRKFNFKSKASSDTEQLNFKLCPCSTKVNRGVEGKV